MKIETISYKTLLKDDRYAYGGHSIVYMLQNSTTCLKVYRQALKDETRKLIKQNYSDLDSVKSLRENPLFLTPLKLYVNKCGALESAQFPFIDALNMWGSKKCCFMTKKYLSITENMIKIVKTLTNKGVVITDLKLANMLVTTSSEVVIIDNDFSIRSKNREMLDQVALMSKNIYMRNYKERFTTTLDENYNKYMLLSMMGILLLDNGTLDKVWPRGSAPSITTLKHINKLIQTDRSIPMTFKKNFSNILTANAAPDISAMLST